MALGRQNRKKALLHKRNAAVTSTSKEIQHMRETLWQMALGRQNRKKSLLHKRNAAVTNVPKAIQHMWETFWQMALGRQKRYKRSSICESLQSLTFQKLFNTCGRRFGKWLSADKKDINAAAYANRCSH